MIIKNYWTLGAVLALGIAAFAVYATQVKASPSFFDRYQTATATTSLAYMTPGTGTTTITANNITPQIYDSARVLLQVTATSTGVAGAVQLKARVEGSMDKVDWYPIAIAANTGLGTTPANATTTLFTTNPYNDDLFVISTSTTPSGNFGGTGSATVVMHSFDIPVAARYMRVVFYDPSGGGNYGLWAEIIGKRMAN